LNNILSYKVLLICQILLLLLIPLWTPPPVEDADADNDAADGNVDIISGCPLNTSAPNKPSNFFLTSFEPQRPNVYPILYPLSNSVLWSATDGIVGEGGIEEELHT
jgi:hypothetical protein